MTGSKKRGPKLKVQKQELPELKDLNPEIIRKTISGIQKAIRENYVFPEQSEDLCQSLDDHLAAGDYDEITESKTFCDQATNHLREIVNDKHIQVLLPQDMAPVGCGPGKKVSRKTREIVGLTKAEILPGNVGYINITMFNALHESADKINGAMLYLKNTNALIFDLRKCRGGYGDAANFLLSYLFDTKFTISLLETYFRPNDLTVRNPTTWTPFKYTKLVYVLTGNFTFSGGEHFAYALKIHGKATLVGTNTGGGAHPVAFVGLDTGVLFKVPIGRTYDPKTNEDWEGKGVIPDISCSEDDALAEALKDSYNKLIAETNDEEERNTYIQLISEL
ncbi:MAG: S41 family peptidase [Candidatus Hodarchaeales archaeon]|jgi:C-terminal processing protease CtpA/Prc